MIGPITRYISGRTRSERQRSRSRRADSGSSSSDADGAPDSWSRRSVLAATGTSAVVGFAGCTEVLGTGVTPAEEPLCLWNERFVEEIQHFRGGNFAPTRRGALLNVAMYDAANGVAAAAGDDHFEPYLVDPAEAPGDASALAAAIGAAHESMTELYGGEFDDDLQATLAAATGGDVDAGEQWGRTVAKALLEHRDDEYTTGIYIPCEEPSQPGCFRRDWNPVHARIEPWAMNSRDQFRPAGPPALESEAYADDWWEVYELGNDAADRPQAHVDIAAFWRGAPGSPRPPNMWNVVTQKLVVDESLSIVEECRLFALLSLALADAGIAGSEAKYEYGFWRPRTAIHEADRDGNTETHADGSWSPLSTGGSPEYTSTLAAYGGAGCAVLEGVLGSDEYAFEFGSNVRTGTSGEDEGVVRSYDSLSAALEESIDSRIYLGNHFRSAMVDGRDQGERIGEWLLENSLRPVE
ncbi:vanadium-dependent haloperoxidase [Natrarchaeobius sp. A-rgal3]|uniref:vanadium-dependent haloperoxidase n=1 Tax=Natrarchaeobius versutus TaxID=1679078 RepID=UPI003510C62D